MHGPRARRRQSISFVLHLSLPRAERIRNKKRFLAISNNELQLLNRAWLRFPFFYTPNVAPSECDVNAVGESDGFFFFQKPASTRPYCFIQDRINFGAFLYGAELVIPHCRPASVARLISIAPQR